MPLLEDLEPEADGRSVRIRPADLVETELVEQALAEGEHKIELSVGRMFLGDSHLHVDATSSTASPPRSTCRPTSIPCRSPTPVTVTGTVEEGAELSFGGEALDADDGEFAVEFDTPPTGALDVHRRRRSRQHAPPRTSWCR